MPLAHLWIFILRYRNLLIIIIIIIIYRTTLIPTIRSRTIPFAYFVIDTHYLGHKVLFTVKSARTKEHCYNGIIYLDAVLSCRRTDTVGKRSEVSAPLLCCVVQCDLNRRISLT